jgi:hypothetical protein
MQDSNAFGDFISVPSSRKVSEEDQGAPLTTRRKRHRRAGKLSEVQAIETHSLKVQATVISNGKEIIVSQARVKEFIDAAITQIFGEEGSKRRFEWRFLERTEKKLSSISLKTADLPGFRAALALFCSEDARLLIVDKVEDDIKVEKEPKTD